MYISCIRSRWLLDFSSPKVHPSSLRVESFISPRETIHPEKTQQTGECLDWMSFFPFILVGIPEQKPVSKQQFNLNLNNGPAENSKEFQLHAHYLRPKKHICNFLMGPQFSLRRLWLAFPYKKRKALNGAFPVDFVLKGDLSWWMLFFSMFLSGYVEVFLGDIWYTPWKKNWEFFELFMRVYYVKPSHLFFHPNKQKDHIFRCADQNHGFCSFHRSRHQLDTS